VNLCLEVLDTISIAINWEFSYHFERNSLLDNNLYWLFYFDHLLNHHRPINEFYHSFDDNFLNFNDNFFNFLYFLNDNLRIGNLYNLKNRHFDNNDFFNDFGNLNNLLDNTRNHYNLLDYFLDFHHSWHLNYSLNDLLNNHVLYSNDLFFDNNRNRDLNSNLFSNLLSYRYEFNLLHLKFFDFFTDIRCGHFSNNRNLLSDI
jgi:hypothetical protein